MKLADKRFWTFEAIIMICTIITLIALWIARWPFHILVAIAYCLLFPVGGIFAWKLYKGNQWWKLATYLFMITTAFLAIALFGFVWDRNDTGKRPENIPPDVGSFITTNELVLIILLLWSIISPLLSCAISLLTKYLIIKPKDNHRQFNNSTNI